MDYPTGVESRDGHSSSICNSCGFNPDRAEFGRGMGGGARVAQVSRAGRQSGSCERKLAGDVVEDSERGMDGGDPWAGMVVADCKWGPCVAHDGRDRGEVEAAADWDRVQQ